MAHFLIFLAQIKSDASPDLPVLVRDPIPVIYRGLSPFYFIRTLGVTHRRGPERPSSIGMAAFAPKLGTYKDRSLCWDLLPRLWSLVLDLVAPPVDPEALSPRLTWGPRKYPVD